MRKIFYLLLILLFSCQPDPVDRATGTDFPYPVRANGGLAITAPLSFGGVTITATGAQINFLSDVTGLIQAQLNSKAATSHTHTGVYLPVTGAGDIYTHNASEFSGTAHNHTGTYVAVADTATAFSKYSRKSLPVYYVSNSGNDAATGTSPVTAWRTIAKINATSFSSGATVKFKCGDTWRETLTISSSGTSDNYITFSSYGEGEKPKIFGSTEVTAWTLSHGNVWYSFNISYIDPYSLAYDGNIYFKGLNGSITHGNVKKVAWVNLAVEYDWAWTLDTLYVYSTVNPGTAYTGIEMTQRLYGVNINNKNYITLDGIEEAYAGMYGIGDYWPATNLTGLTIKNCEVHHNGIKTIGYGLEVWHSNMIIQNNVLHDNGRRNLSMNIYLGNVQVSNVLIEDNIFYHGFHTTGVDISTGGVGSIDSIIIRDNLYFDDLSETLDGTESYHAHMIFAEEESTGDITNLYIYNNVFKNTTYSAIALLHVTSSYVYNNTFYGVNPNQSNDYGSMLYIGAGTVVDIRNNLFYNNMLQSTISYACMGVAAGATATSDFNLYYTTDAPQRLIARNVGWGDWTRAQWADYLSQSGQDMNSPTPADPLFVTGSAYELQSTSPAIDVGTLLIKIPKIDYLGNKRIGLFDIGCHEKQ